MAGGVEGNPLVFVVFEKSGGVVEAAALALGAVGLEVAEGVERFLKLAREAVALDAEVGEESMGVDDVEGDFAIERDGGGGAGEHVGFKQRDAIETPGGVGEFLDELGFGGGGGLVFVEEAAAMCVVGGGIFGGENGGGGGEAVAQRVERRMLLAGGGAGAGGVLGVGAIDGGAEGGGTMYLRGWHG